MAKGQRLTPQEREFFQQLAEIIFSNPFSIEPAKLKALSGQDPVLPPLPDEHHYTTLVPALEQRLATLEARGIHTLAGVHQDDRLLLEYAYLFQAHHRFVDDIDAMIRAQMRQGDEPVEAPYAHDMLAQLKSRGFPENEALEFVALSYQFSRAYFFIAHGLVGASASMKQLRHALWNNVFTADVRLYADHLRDRMEDFSTLLLGETGTGKGSAAAAIGRSGSIPFDPKSGRFKYSFTQTFIPINLSEFPESLIESELFGHRKGAFTGAIDNHKGLFERCSPHGSLFLDEIGDIPVPVQIKLLNVLQQRQFTPVGSHETRRFAGRVIAATNRALTALREHGEFRDDFYYRLSSDVIEVPPLRRRLQESPEELEQLVDLLIERMTGNPSPELSARVRDVLRSSLPRNYAWPGNVRELEQAVRRIILNGEYTGSVEPSNAEQVWLQQAAHGRLTAQEILAGYCHSLYQQFGTYEEVAAHAALDRRTAKKYVEAGLAMQQSEVKKD